MRITSIGNEYIDFKGEMYLRFVSGNLLPKVWEDLHHWFCSAIAPKEWRYVLANTAPSSFSNVDKAYEGMTQF